MAGDPDPFARNWEQYQALVGQLQAHQIQLDAAWRHYSVFGARLGRVLNEARFGVLELGWRDRLSATATTTQELDTDSPAERACREAENLALHEVVMTPAADWEPYAAGGDWRRALASWAAAMHDLTNTRYRTKRWLSDIGRRGVTPGGLTERPVIDTSNIDEILEAREHDAIEASQRAGLAAGGESADWRGWYRARILETWSPADDSTFRLYYSVERLLAELDRNDGCVTGGNQITIIEHLPNAWRLPPPGP